MEYAGYPIKASLYFSITIEISWELVTFNTFTWASTGLQCPMQWWILSFTTGWTTGEYKLIAAIPLNWCLRLCRKCAWTHLARMYLLIVTRLKYTYICTSQKLGTIVNRFQLNISKYRLFLLQIKKKYYVELKKLFLDKCMHCRREILFLFNYWNH